ncbi:MAG: DUF1592 domain-containing protein [Vicinamibacterales bacterium]
MTTRFGAGFAVALLGLGATPVAAQVPAMAAAHATGPMTAEAGTALVQQYCVTCHNDRTKAGSLSLADFDAADAPGRAQVAEKMIRKLRTGMMPPSGARRPEGAALTDFATSLETRIDRAAAAAPAPGWRPFQRLNRSEYARAVRDMLGLDVDVAAFLPADTVSDGFDNVADVQTFSPTLLEGYLRAAGEVARLAVGDRDATATESTYKVPKTASQMRRVEGAPLGTRGGTSVVHVFPADGDYQFQVEFFAEPLGLLFGSTTPGEQIEVSVNGERVALFDIDPKMSEEKTGLSLKTDPVHVKAGPRRVSAAFLQRFEGPINDFIAPIEHTMADTEIGVAFGITTLPHLRALTVIGPHTVSGVSDTPSRRRIFTCRPTTAAEESACAASIVKDLSSRAFRAPVSDRDFERLMAFYEEGRQERDFEFGVRSALEAILASPQFLFRLEASPTAVRAGDVYRISDLELASRLSFFLWGAPPDRTLVELAAAGRLSAKGELDRQMTRLLADPRAEALSTRFAAQWLRLQDLEKVFPDAVQFPYYDHTLADALQRETELFFDSLVREDRSILDLLTADYTFMNERVAKHYGVSDVTGSRFRRVPVPEYRRGILGHASILTLTSVADRTSPVMRGKWVMEVLLGSPPPPPPPNVPALEETKAASDGKLLSVRERMEAHRANPACNSCHRVIDPLGLTLENFDVTGRWRIKDNEVPVDAAGTLYDGTAMAGPAGLRSALLAHQDAFLLSFTENLMTYALGRRVEYFDMPAIRAIIHDAAADGYTVSTFIREVVHSDAFRLAQAPPVSETTTAAGRQDGGRQQ